MSLKENLKIEFQQFQVHDDDHEDLKFINNSLLQILHFLQKFTLVNPSTKIKSLPLGVIVLILILI